MLTQEQHKAALRNEYNFDHPGIKLKQINRIKHLLNKKTLLFLVNFSIVQLFGVIPATAILTGYKKFKIALDELFWD